MLQNLLLSQFAVRLQVVTDQLEGPELQLALGRLGCVQFSRASGCQISGMGVRILQTQIKFVEVCPRYDAFTANLKI